MLRVTLVCLVIIGAGFTAAQFHGAPATTPPPTPPPTGPPARAVLCLFNRVPFVTTHGAFAATLYAREFPATEWVVRPLAGSTLRETVMSYLSRGEDCDFLSLSVSSSFAVGLSPLVPTSVAWVGTTETSSELSDAGTHPSFNRIIPTATVTGRGLAHVAADLGWHSGSVICSDEPYGRSLADGISRGMLERGGSVDASRCYPRSATTEDVVALIEEVLSTSKSRVLFAASGLQSFWQAVAITRAATRAFIVAPEQGCNNAVDNAGLFCLIVGAHEARLNAYNGMWFRRNVTEQAAIFAGVMPPSLVGAMVPADLFFMYSADAVRLGMKAIYTFWQRNATRYPTMAEWVRQQQIDGVTGHVTLDANGDREFAIMQLMNVQPINATHADLVQVASVEEARVNFTAPIYFAIDNVGMRTAANAPSGMKPVPEAEKEFPWWAVVIPLLVAIFAAVLASRQIAARMALARCPLDAAQPFTVAFVSVANEDAVRAQHPDDAPKAFTRLAAIVRREAGRHGCHEARRVDEVTVMLVAKRAEDAARCGAAIVAAAVEEPWGQHLRDRGGREHGLPQRDDKSLASSRRSKLSASQRTRQSSTSRSKVAPEGVVPPLVNVGVHTGLGAIEHDAATGALSYHGAVVAAAAHVADAGAGDHVVLSEACVDAVADVAALDGAVQELQRLSVKAAGGVALDCGLFSLVPEADAAYEAALQARIDAQARLRARGDADGGAIVAALSQAESGFARRRVAVVCAFVPGLADAAGRAMGEAEQAQAVQQALDEIADVAGRSRGRVAGVVDGRVFVTVNGSGAQVSQPDARAALIAHQLAFELPRASRRLRGISCGVASSRALVGASRDAPAMLGTARTFARVAQQAAARLRVPALAVDTGYDDVASTMQVVTVDAVALPLGPRADAAHRITRLVQLIEPLDNTADGEWLYNVGGAAQGTNGGEAAGDAAAQEQEWAKHAADASRDMAAATAAAASGVPAAPTPTVPITGGGSNPQSPDAEPLVLAEDAVRIAARRLAAAKEAPSFTAYCMQRSAELRIAF